MTTLQMELADYLDEMPVGETAEINGHYVTRDYNDTYEVDGVRYCFVQVYDILTA